MANVLTTYKELKAKHPDAVLLFRCGDFYETYEDDAKICADVLGITLTKRTGSPKGEGYMAGFPHHALDAYLPKIVRAGHRVAICDMPEPTTKLVRRGSDELTTTATNNSTDNNSKSQENMKLTINNTNNTETKNVQNAQVANTAITPIKVAEGSVPMSPEAFRAEYPDIEDAEFEEVPQNTLSNQNTPSNQTSAYYRQLADRIREAHAKAARQATRFIYNCELELRKPRLPLYGAGSVQLLETELYKRIDVVEREGGELKTRWQHCLAEVTVRLMNAQPQELSESSE